LVILLMAVLSVDREPNYSVRLRRV
jgi:hypothetical protein